VVEDPAWPRLAEAIGRAHAAGWDVRVGVPRLLAQREMPERHPAGELHFRLMADCPAAMPTPRGVVGEVPPAPRPGSAPDAAVPPARPNVDQPPPGR
jgi:hypothetical protein